MKFLQEFKTFAIKGNVIDMAIGIIIGTAFNKIVTSLVEDLVMPPIGYFAGGLKFDNFKFILREAVLDEKGKVLSDVVSINYGNFVQILVNFLIIAFSMFMVVTVMNRIRHFDEKKQELQESLRDKKVENALSKEAELLKEIRDLLKKNKSV